MKIIGIDPGKKGAVAIIGSDGRIHGLTSCPVVKMGKTKTDYDVAWMARLIRDHLDTGSISLAVIEKVHAMPKQGVSSSFGFGRGLGLWEGIVTALSIPLLTPSAAAWMRDMHAGVPGGDTKGRSIVAAQRLFPTADLMPGKKRKPDDGLAEALLLAEYGRRIVANK